MQSEIKLTPKLLKELAKDVLLELSDDEINGILAIETNIMERFEQVLAIDTTNVKPLFYPFETPRSYLRNDDESQTINQNLVLKNAPKVIGPYIAISRVVK